MEILHFQCPRYDKLRGEVNELAGNFCHMIGLDQYQLKMMEQRLVLMDQRVEWLLKRITELEGGDNGAG